MAMVFALPEASRSDDAILWGVDLLNGQVPLPLLEEQVERYIQSKLETSAS